MYNRFKNYKDAIQEGILPRATISVLVDLMEVKGKLTETEVEELRNDLNPVVIEEIIEEE
jgi:hypothetical protein